MIEVAGADRVISLDLNRAQIQGFFGPRCVCENLESQVILVHDLMNNKLISDLDNLMIISSGADNVYKALSFCDIYNYYNDSQSTVSFLMRDKGKDMKSNELLLVGDVEGYDCLIICNTIETGVIF